MMNIEHLLSKIENDIIKYNMSDIAPMLGDRWLLASALQKSIRRGDIVRATQAAEALWNKDRQSLWRRLHITAMEDVGLGDADVMTITLTITAAHSWRRKIGDRRAALYIARLLAGAVKSRIADHLFSQADKAKGYESLRNKLANTTDDLLADYAAHPESPLVERALALWFLAGTKKYPSDRLPLRAGSPEYAAEVLNGLDVPCAMVEACKSVMSRTPWPLWMFMPLIYQEVQKQSDAQSIECPLLYPTLEVEGVPLYAMDMFTRVGQSSIRQFQKAVPFLRNFTVKQIGLGVFYAEGCHVNLALQSAQINEFSFQGEIADAEGSGMDVPQYLALQDCLASALPILNEIRMVRLTEYLQGKQDE